MKDALEYIEEYFRGGLTANEKLTFEERCSTDEAFAAEVASYVSMRDSMRQYLDEQKKAEFAELYTELSASPPQLTTKQKVLKLAPYLSAACILIIAAYALFFGRQTPQRISLKYIAANFSTLGQTMGAKVATGSMQQGITAYNTGNYKQAELIFRERTRHPADATEAIKNLGITYLVTEKYEQAIAEFDLLSKAKLYSNPGRFYKAITLLKRAEGDDVEQARQILEEVISNDLAGSKEAKNLLQKL